MRKGSCGICPAKDLSFIAADRDAHERDDFRRAHDVAVKLFGDDFDILHGQGGEGMEQSERRRATRT